jgi:hypothetical protein
MSTVSDLDDAGLGECHSGDGLRQIRSQQIIPDAVVARIRAFKAFIPSLQPGVAEIAWRTSDGSLELCHDFLLDFEVCAFL